MALTEVHWRSIGPSRDATDISPSLGVRRCLFGPVDHSEIRTDLQREMKTMVEDGIRRWNFDFERETPLKGTYLWQKLPRNDVPSSSITLNSRIFNTRDSSCTKSANVESNSSTTTTTTTSITRCGKSTTQASKKAEQNPRKRVAISKITGKNYSII